MNDLARILGLAGLATEQSVAAPADRELKEYSEEGCPCCDGGRCTCPGDCPDCNCHGNNDWDESVEEAAKPDFLDVDKDGDKKEPMKKALKDKEVKEGSGDAPKHKEEDADDKDWDDADWDDAEEMEEMEEMKESEWCGVCGNDTCSCTDTMVESPTMDTTQLVIMMRNAGLSEETITQKLEEWANTPEGVGEVEPTAHGDAYDFAQSVNLSLKRYLDAQDMKVQVTEHKVEDMKALYEAHKAKK